MMSDEMSAAAANGGGGVVDEENKFNGDHTSAMNDAFDQESQQGGVSSLPGVDDTNVIVKSDATDLELPLEGNALPQGEGDLPNPDSIPRITHHRRRVQERKKKALWGACGLILICVVTLLCVALFGPGDAAKSSIPGITGTSNGRPSGPTSPSSPSYPSPSPPSPPSGGGSNPSNTDAVRLVSIREYLISNGISTPGSLAVMGSPQHEALEWLATADPLRIPLPATMDSQLRLMQRYTLAVIFYALGGKVTRMSLAQVEEMGMTQWRTNLNWMVGDNECEWNMRYKNGDGEVDLGVICDEGGGDDGVDNASWRRVTRIWVPWDHKLSGTLPPEIRHLTELTSISLAYQTIGGRIPDEVCNLANLEELSLSNNYLTDTLPSCLGKMSSLRILALDDNFLDGDLDVVDDMKALEFLYLEDNHFEHDVTLNFLQDLDRLIHLDISGNKLRGELPSQLFAHPNMKVMDLHNNAFTGPLPPYIEKQNVLEFVALHRNELTGTIENSLGNLTKLLYLDLAHNNFTGKLEEDGADGIGSLTTLKYLFLGGNRFDAQEFPPFLANLDGLLELSLKDSSLLGPIPEWIDLLEGLYLLDLDGNLLSGNIPTEVGSLVNLQYLLLNRNELTGQVPLEMNQLSNLQVLLLDDNSLTGSLDDSVCPALANGTEVSADCAVPGSDGDGGDGGFLSNTTVSASNGTAAQTEVPSNNGTQTETTQPATAPSNDTQTGTTQSATGPSNNGTTLTETTPQLDDDAAPINGTATPTQTTTTTTSEIPPNAQRALQPEITCSSSCCTICCTDDDGEPCNDDKWIANNDPIWEHRYGRYKFVFENGVE